MCTLRLRAGQGGFPAVLHSLHNQFIMLYPYDNHIPIVALHGQSFQAAICVSDLCFIAVAGRLRAQAKHCPLFGTCRWHTGQYKTAISRCHINGRIWIIPGPVHLE